MCLKGTMPAGAPGPGECFAGRRTPPLLETLRLPRQRARHGLEEATVVECVPAAQLIFSEC